MPKLRMNLLSIRVGSVAGHGVCPVPISTAGVVKKALVTTLLEVGEPLSEGADEVEGEPEGISLFVGSSLTEGADDGLVDGFELTDGADDIVGKSDGCALTVGSTEEVGETVGSSLMVGFALVVGAGDTVGEFVGGGVRGNWHPEATIPTQSCSHSSAAKKSQQPLNSPLQKL
jgi:hypothetical protein